MPEAQHVAVVYFGERFLAPGELPMVSAHEPGFLLGESVFETLRAYAGRCFRPAAHVQRLVEGAHAMELNGAHSGAEMSRLLDEAAARVGGDAQVRITLSRVARREREGRLLIVAEALRAYPPWGYERGTPTDVVAARRVPEACLDPRIKTGNYLPSLLGRREAEARGMLEGIQCAVGGEIAGGCMSNLFLVRAGALYTPHLASGCRPGMTRDAVIECARALNIEVNEREISPHDLRLSSEAFFTNSLMECLPIASAAACTFVAPGPTTRALHDELRRLIARETSVHDEVPA